MLKGVRMMVMIIVTVYVDVKVMATDAGRFIST